MSRSFTLLLLLMAFTSSCTFPLYKLTVSSDAYAVAGSYKFDSHKIFLNPDVSKNDLSKLPYYQKIKTGLMRQGVELVNSLEESDLILFFDVTVRQPLTLTHSGTTEGSPTKSSTTKTNPDGTSETVEVVAPGQSYSYSDDYHTYSKVLTLKLYTKSANELIWQSENIVNDEVDSYGPYASSLVYTALRNFLRNTPDHPELTRVGLREGEYMEQPPAQRNQE